MSRSLWLWVVLATASGCGGIIDGNRRLIERDREVPAFTGLEVEQGIVATLATGPHGEVHLTGEANLVDTLQLDVQDGVLRASWRFLIVKHHPVTLTVALPELTSLHARGGSQVQAEGVKRTARFDASAEDGSALVVSGEGADELSVRLSGGSLGDFDGFPVVSADLDVSGGSQAELRVSGELRGFATEGSAIRLRGQPRLVRVEVTGDSSVETVAP